MNAKRDIAIKAAAEDFCRAGDGGSFSDLLGVLIQAAIDFERNAIADAMQAANETECGPYALNNFANLVRSGEYET